MKFINGDIVTHKDFGDMFKKSGSEDFLETFEKIRELDSPIQLVGTDGVVYKSSGKQLVSVELIF